MTEEENKKNIQILLDDYLQLESMEENTFEWNLDILAEKYNVKITNIKPHIYTTNEVWDLYRNDKDFFYTSFSDFTKSNGFVFIKQLKNKIMRTIKEIRQSVVQISDDFKVGDYVFACKWSDAEPTDRWAVDIIKEVSLNIGNGMAGIFFESSGIIPYKYAVKIIAKEGNKILRYWLNRYK